MTAYGTDEGVFNEHFLIDWQHFCHTIKNTLTEIKINSDSGISPRGPSTWICLEMRYSIISCFIIRNLHTTNQLNCLFDPCKTWFTTFVTHCCKHSLGNFTTGSGSIAYISRWYEYNTHSLYCLGYLFQKQLFQFFYNEHYIIR